jgi:hypothetical protein
MALFSFTDIKFSSKSDARSSSNRLTGDSAYDYNIMKYPIDLGDVGKGHYMVIHVNQQRNTKFKVPLSGDLPTIFENRQRFGASNIPTAALDVVNKIGQEINRFTKTNTIKNVELPQNFDISFLRTIERTVESIALYMPDTLNYSHTQSYSDLSISGAIAAGVSTIQSIDEIKENLKNMNIGGLANNFSPFIARAFQGSDLFRSVFAGVAGKVINPMMELIYTSPAFREFRFSFMFYPRSEKEAQEVQRIINRLKFHQAPEIDLDDGGIGFFLVPPSEFDIKFYYNGKENPNIPKMSTCVLTALDVNYAPSGFAAYEVPGESASLGRTGMPVGIQLDLLFKETEIMTKNNFSEKKVQNYTEQQIQEYNRASQAGEFGTS